MGSIIIKYGLILSIIFLLSACIGDADLTGFVRSTDRIEERYQFSAEWNETHPAEKLITTREEYDILVAADLHIGDTTCFLNFLAQGTQPEATAMVFVGDIVSGKEKDYETFNRLLPVDNIKPSFALVGNHELYFDGWKHFSRLFGSSVYYFTIATPTKEDLYICLDSGSGTLGKSQLKWLKDLLENSRSNYDQCVIFTHVNFFRDHHTLSTNPLTNELLVLIDLFEQNKVNMVVMGHDHDRSLNILGNTTYLTMDALLYGLPNSGYIRLKKDNTGIQHEFIELVIP
jgi:predicted phosphodiesterase